jgi:hypothetical protein
MFSRIRPFAAAGLLMCVAVGQSRADGEIEKPPGVPPEVTQAKTACPTLHGSCFGFYPTRWRVLSDCCTLPATVIVAPSRAPAAPAPKPRPVDSKAGTTKPDTAPKLQMAGGCGAILVPDEGAPAAAKVVPSSYNRQR